MKPLRPEHEVLQDWVHEVAEKLGRSVASLLEHGLRADEDFSCLRSVEVRPGMDMCVRFESAFAVIRPESAQAAVFTEHAGYVEFDLEQDAVVAEIVETVYRHDLDD